MKFIKIPQEDSGLDESMIEGSRKSKFQRFLCNFFRPNLFLASRILPDAILVSIFLAISVLCLIFARKSQDELLPHYHDFADHRKILGIPNFFDVVSNAPYLQFGLMGLCALFSMRNEYAFTNRSSEYWTYVFFFLAIIGTGMIFGF